MSNDAGLVLLDKHQVDQLLEPEDVLRAVVEAFTLHSQGEGRVFPVVRERLTTGGVFGIKSGDVEAEGLLGFKAAGFWPANRQANGEPHQATVLLFDPLTGRPTCMIDGNAVTTVRTGAAGGLGLSLLARSNSQQLCVFGNGVQARSQLDFALTLLPGIRQVTYLTHKRKADADFEALFAGRCELSHSVHANASVNRADIVITATPGGGVLFDSDAVRPGTHINAVGADTRGKRELPAGLLALARVFVDDRVQARQIGELQWAPDIDCLQIGDVLTRAVAFERQAHDITVFDMTGLALQDLTVSRMLLEKGKARNIGTLISWPW